MTCLYLLDKRANLFLANFINRYFFIQLFAQLFISIKNFYISGSMSIPIIQIDSEEARKIDVTSVLRRIYYQPSGYQRTAKKLLMTASAKNAEYDFIIDEVKDWLERQAVHQIHKPRPKYIPRARLSSITMP